MRGSRKRHDALQTKQQQRRQHSVPAALWARYALRFSTESVEAARRCSGLCIAPPATSLFPIPPDVAGLRCCCCCDDPGKRAGVAGSWGPVRECSKVEATERRALCECAGSEWSPGELLALRGHAVGISKRSFTSAHFPVRFLCSRFGCELRNSGTTAVREAKACWSCTGGRRQCHTAWPDGRIPPARRDADHASPRTVPIERLHRLMAGLPALDSCSPSCSAAPSAT